MHADSMSGHISSHGQPGHSSGLGLIHHADIENIPWYHPGLTRHQAECMLMQNGSDGSYLMRPSATPNQYAISARGKDSVKHIVVSCSGGLMVFGMATFRTVCDMLKHFDEHPLLAGETGVLTVLKNPYPRDIEEPSGVYELVKVHASFGGNKTLERAPHIALGSKEGFLTKRGGNRKNWKTRWFVLVRNELSYFRSNSDKHPVRTLDLGECTECLRDNSMDKSNCFRLVFPFRTFYMYASTEEEMYEWFDLIHWKLERIRKDKT